MAAEPVTDGNFLAQLTGAGATIGTVVYLVWRKFKSDKTSDKITDGTVSLARTVDERTQALITNLEEQLKRKDDENTKLGSVIDRLAGERNEAVIQVGKLEATVTILGQEVKKMEEELSKLKEENKQLVETVQRMTLSLNEMGNKFVEMTSHLKELEKCASPPNS